MARLIDFVRLLVFSLRFRLLLLVTLVCTPFVGFTLRRAWQTRDRQKAGWRQRARNMAKLSAREERRMIGETRQLLLAVAKSAPVRSGNRQSSQKLLAQVFRSYPRYAGLGVAWTNGQVLASTLPRPERVNQADLNYFRETLRRRAFSIGSFPFAQSEGRHLIRFGIPTTDRSGQVRSVVFAALDLDWFHRFNSELPKQLPKGATWTELDHDGRVLVSYPSPEGSIGESFPERSLLKTFFSSSSGVTEALNSRGVPTTYAFASAPGLLVPGVGVGILSIPTARLFAAADQSLQRDLMWLGVTLLAGLVLGWVGGNVLVVRPVKALVESSRRLAAGDLRVRTGLPAGRDELGQLTGAFDHMAHALELREHEHQNACQNLQILSRRLVEVQENERRHIARELHDEVGQTLTVAEMNLQAALQTPVEAPLAGRLRHAIQAVEQVLAQVHDLSLNLRPSMLDDLGLESALRWYTSRQSTLTGLQTEFRSEPLERRLDSVIETECFRVAQEALNNAVRHARARRVTVELRRGDGHLHLMVRDDGTGFDVAAGRERAVRGGSLGLLSMEERARLAGGRLELRSTPGRGTEVHAWFPLRWQLPKLLVSGQ